MQICMVAFSKKLCTTIVALSSGNSSLESMPHDHHTLQKFLASMVRYKQCIFQPFNEEETNSFMLRKQLKYDRTLLYTLTYYNPWLLSILPSQPITTAAVTGVVRVNVLRYVKSLIDSFKNVSLNHWVGTNLQATDRWLYKASNGVPLTSNDIMSFYESWVYIEYICEIHEKENIVVCNIPYIQEFLLKELSQLQRWKEIPNNPVLNGYIFEEDFLRQIYSLRYIEVCSWKSGINRSYKFRIDYLWTMNVGEMLPKMEKGMLYHLRHNHPVIDAVGLLRRTDKSKYHLIFVQVSMTKYASHSSKIKDLFRVVDCKELKASKSASILEHYKSMITETAQGREAFYMYVCPSEVGKDNISQGLKEEYEELRITVIPEQSETNQVISNIVSRF